MKKLEDIKSPEDMINQVVNCNCIDLMKLMPDNFVDMTLTSPPYDDLRDYDGYSFDFENIAKELFRITKQGGVVVWVVGDATIKGSETGTSFRQALYFKEIGFNLHDTMIFEKDKPRYPSKVRYYQCFEYMFVLSKGKPKTVNLLCDRRNIYASQSRNTFSQRGKDGKLVIMGKRVSFKDFGVRFNVWRYSVGLNLSTRDRIAFKHPAVFPEKLAEDHILSWSNEGDLIFDPMCGSGTTLKMAKILGRNYIGSDISEEYCKITEERLRLVQKRLL